MKSIILSMIAAVSLVFAGSAMAEEMPALAKKSGCAGCHSIDKKKVGPAWADVGKAYNSNGKTSTGVNVSDILAKNNAKTAEAWLMTKVAKGGSGNWGSAMMVANAPRVSEADIKELVQFILSHK